jgi:hypothetical protein
LYRPPVPTNELVESIYSEFEKVFDGNNAFEKVEFTDPDLEQDFTDYRKRIGDFQFWETQGFETFKNSIDNILVVDLPKLQRDATGNLIQSSDRPEPYYFLLDIDNLVDIDNTKVKALDSVSGKQFYYFKTEYIIFRSGEILYGFDDDFYRAYEIKDGADPKLIDEVPHGLGYCPARSFWTTPLNSHCTIQKRAVITNSLSELDWLLFFTISERYLQLYAPFPIYAVYKSKCTYKEVDGQHRKCVDGYLEIEGQRMLEAHREQCPRCKNKIKVGPGNILEIAPPRDKSEDADLMTNPMKVIPAERQSLDYMKEALRDIRLEIFKNCVGRSQDPKNNQAQNEKQIESSFESSESVLLKVKRNFEIVHEFALETCARLRYRENFLSISINYGDEFFNKSENEEVADYKLAVENGLPEYDLALRRDDINTARYRNNPKILERTKILRNLLPFPDLSIDKVREMRESLPEVVALKDLVVKMKFNEFIDRFEREQTNILLYASAIDFDRKINLIAEELNKYAGDYLAAAKADAPKPPPPPPGPIPAPAPAAA